MLGMLKAEWQNQVLEGEACEDLSRLSIEGVVIWGGGLQNLKSRARSSETDELGLRG